MNRSYHRTQVIIGAILLALALYMLGQGRSVPPADYTVAWVSSHALAPETAEAISQEMAQYGQDLDGNGQVQVSIHQIKLDLASVLVNGTQGQQEYGELLALDADLEAGQSGIFFTDDPAALQACTGALLYLDGTTPEPGAMDWENMFLPWAQEGAGRIYAGCRGCWKADWEETFDQYQQLWRGFAEALQS